MMSVTVQINELRVRVAGLTREQARHFGATVAQRLSEGLHHHGSSQRIGSLDLQIAAPPRTPCDQLAESVAHRILGALR